MNIKIDKNFKDVLPLVKDLTKDKAEAIFGKSNVNEGYFTCKMCGSKVPLSDTHVINTPILKNVIDSTCKVCRDTCTKEKYCKIVCIGCKEVILWMEPQKDPKSGFEFKPGAVYHIEDCPKCNPDKFKNKVVPTEILESKIYKQKYNK